MNATSFSMCTLALKFQGDPLAWVFHNIPCSCSPLSCSLLIFIDFSHCNIWNQTALKTVWKLTLDQMHLFLALKHGKIFPEFLCSLEKPRQELELSEIKSLCDTFSRRNAILYIYLEFSSYTCVYACTCAIELVYICDSVILSVNWGETALTAAINLLFLCENWWQGRLAKNWISTCVTNGCEVTRGVLAAVE